MPFPGNLCAMKVNVFTSNHQRQVVNVKSSPSSHQRQENMVKATLIHLETIRLAPTGHRGSDLAGFRRFQGHSEGDAISRKNPSRKYGKKPPGRHQRAMGGHTRYKIVIWFREEEDDADSREFVKDWWLDVNVLTFVAQIFPENDTAVGMALKSAKIRRIRSSMACWYRPRGRGPGCGARDSAQGPGPATKGLGRRWGQPQFVLRNLWQIRMNQHHLLPLWTRWRSYGGCDRPWPVGASRVVSRLIKVTFYRIFLTDFSGKWHRLLNGLEIGKNPSDPILDGLLVPAGWSPGGLKLLFIVFSWVDDLKLTWQFDVNLLTFVAQIFPWNDTTVWMPKSWTNSQIPSLKMTLPATDPKTTTTELKPAIFQ